jgi:hypothetical protein
MSGSHMGATPVISPSTFPGRRLRSACSADDAVVAAPAVRGGPPARRHAATAGTTVRSG